MSGMEFWKAALIVIAIFAVLVKIISIVESNHKKKKAKLLEESLFKKEYEALRENIWELYISITTLEHMKNVEFEEYQKEGAVMRKDIGDIIDGIRRRLYRIDDHATKKEDFLLTSDIRRLYVIIAALFYSMK